MDEIIIATYNFLDDLEASDLIKNITKYKQKLLNNKKLLNEIKQIKKITDSSLLITKRQTIYSNKDYEMYMRYYNELSLIIMRINKQYKKYTNTKMHNCS